MITAEIKYNKWVKCISDDLLRQHIVKDKTLWVFIEYDDFYWFIVPETIVLYKKSHFIECNEDWTEILEDKE